MHSSPAIIAAVFLAAMSPTLAVADTPPHGPMVINAVFSDAEQETIRQYFLKHPDQLQTLGHAEYAGAIERGRQLPQGTLDQARPLPPDLEHALPPTPKGYERVILAGKVLLVDKAAQVVHDVI